MNQEADRLLFALLKTVAPEGVQVGYSGTILYVDKGKRPANGLALTFLFPRDLPELLRDGERAWRPDPASIPEGGDPDQPAAYLTRPMGVPQALYYQVDAWTTDQAVARALVDGVTLKIRRGYQTGEDDRLYYVRRIGSTRDRSDRARGFFQYQWDFEVHGWVVPAEEKRVPAITEVVADVGVGEFVDVEG